MTESSCCEERSSHLLLQTNVGKSANVKVKKFFP